MDFNQVEEIQQNRDMVKIAVVLLILAFNSPFHIFSAINTMYPPICQFTARLIWGTGRNRETSIYCENVGVDGKSLGESMRNEYLRKGPVFDATNQRNLSFSDIIESVTFIGSTWALGNVTIEKDDLGNFSKLRILDLDSSRPNPAEYYLTIQPSEFKNKPKLTEIRIDGFILVNTTIQALLSLKDQIRSLTIKHSSPVRRFLNEVAKFTNLTEFSRFCQFETFPETMFRNLASKLRGIEMSHCELPNMTSRLFQGMRNLLNLDWRLSNITTIEAGAFDELVNLEMLVLKSNELTSLPPGLFNKTRKLKFVDLSNNEIDNISRENFTHLDNYGEFRLLI